MIKGRRYVIYALDAKCDPRFVGLADSLEEARKIKFDAELARFRDVVIADASLKRVE